MALPLPTKTRIRYCSISGYDVTLHVNGVKVYETVCKPYLTATLMILDTNNIINQMQLVGGEPVYFVFDGNEKRVFEANMHILSMKGEAQNSNLRTILYTIELIGKEYFNDRVNLVQQAFRGITGTDAIQKLHNQFIKADLPLIIKSASLGMLATFNSYIVRATKPFKAIDDIRKTLHFAQYKTGNSLYYRERDAYVLAPLEQLFKELSVQEYFIQEATWGKDWFDIVRAERAIIAARSEVGHDGQTTGKAGLAELASVAQQSKQVFDIHKTRLAQVAQAARIMPGAVVGTAIVDLLGSILQGKSHGGEPNYHIMDENRRPVETDTSAKTERERLYAATAKGGPRITVKVPIQTGVNVTVGKGVYLKLIPPTGDQDTGPQNISGNWLVIDLVHDIQQDDQMYNATTTMRCIRGGIDEYF